MAFALKRSRKLMMSIRHHALTAGRKHNVSTPHFLTGGEIMSLLMMRQKGQNSEENAERNT